MDKIQLLYIENVITRKKSQVQQQLTFFMLVENISYDKQVDVVWAGEDGCWHTLAVKYHCVQGHDKEYWRTQVVITLNDEQSLPGNIQFGLRFRVHGFEYWDNNKGLNYSSDADSGIKLANSQVIQNIGFESYLNDGQNNVPVTVAVDQSFNAETVTIHWTTDRWNTTQYEHCQLKGTYWNKALHSNARNPNQYGIQIWEGRINNGDSFRLQYSICCESHGQIVWENNYGSNYSFQREQLKVLILNLHCYQEENQDEKFSKIAEAIDDLDVDIVCLQEVAELWNDGHGDWESNSARIINERLKLPFHIHTDWSHLGFDKYREGVAILSRYPLSDHDSGYVSDSHDAFSIHSRKVVMARVHVPYVGPVNVFSAHLSWLEDGFQEQFQRLHEWAETRHSGDVKATMLCGDFNITAGTSGYELVVDSNEYDDQYLAANEQGVFEKIFRVNDSHWQSLLADDYRIDYIFMNKTSELQVTSAKVVFTDQDYGQVSDHCGYFMTFEPK
ncbi:MAG: endonuclease/exonuclease/phosphatase family protein [Methylococcaceae bacterium]